MSIQGPNERSTIQLRASRFVKKLGALGGLKFPNGAPAWGPRTRSGSMDVPRKPFTSTSQPALVSHRIPEGSSERSSDESIQINCVQDGPHKRGMNMSSCNESATAKASLPFPFLPQTIPGIVVTQHALDSRLGKNGSTKVVSEAPAGLAAYDHLAQAPSAMDSKISTSPTVKSSAQRSQEMWPTPRWNTLLSTGPSPSFPQALQQQQHGHPFDSGANTALSNVAPETIQRSDPVFPAPDQTPSLLPWTPPITSLRANINAVPSGAISPMALGSPVVPPSHPPPSSTSSLSIWLPRLTAITPPSFSSTSRSPLNRPELFDQEGHSLRLSPAVIQRVPPWPIRSLPSVPLTASPDSDVRPALTPRVAALQQESRRGPAPLSNPRSPSSSRLSSMPALPMSGSVRPQVHDQDNSLYHEAYTATSGRLPELDLAQDMDEDEIDEMEQEQVQGDHYLRSSMSIDGSRPSMDSVDEMEMMTEYEPTPPLGTRDRTQFIVDVMGWDTDTDTQSFVTAPTSLSPRPELGLFNFKRQSSTSFTPRIGDSTPVTPDAVTRPVKHRPPWLGEGMKPMGHHSSHSMFDLHMMAPPSSPLPVQSSRSPGVGAEQVTKRRSIARRQSMPSMTALPPAYEPREGEEGGERLPMYSNSIFLIAQMPRKVEFTQPGVLSRDRKWRRVWCILEGTKFSLYRVKGVKSVWEGVVGAGDGTVYRVNNGKGKEKEIAAEQAEQGKIRKVEEETLTVWEETRRGSLSRQPSPSPTASSFLTPPHPVSPPLSRRPSSSNIVARSSEEEPTSSNRLGHGIHLRARMGRSASSSSLATRSEPDRPDRSLLIREYTLQHAESGLGSDYTKRQNVIRVRLEGEQFLLQAKDSEDVVEWIEGFQAASDIALDLDERKMPRGPLFPRRRRRRRPRPNAERGLPDLVMQAATDT